MGRPTLLRVRLVHHETSHQKDALVSTFFCLCSSSLKIVTVFCNLVFFETMQVLLLSLATFTAYECLLSSIILDTQPLTLINGNSVSGMTWELPKKVLHQMRIRLSRGLPAIASPPRAESPSPSRRPAAAPIHPTREEEFVKAPKGGSSAPSTASTGPSPPCSDYFS